MAGLMLALLLVADVDSSGWRPGTAASHARPADVVQQTRSTTAVPPGRSSAEPRDFSDLPATARAAEPPRPWPLGQVPAATSADPKGIQPRENQVVPIQYHADIPTADALPPTTGDILPDEQREPGLEQHADGPGDGLPTLPETESPPVDEAASSSDGELQEWPSKDFETPPEGLSAEPGLYPDAETDSALPADSEPSPDLFNRRRGYLRSGYNEPSDPAPLPPEFSGQTDALSDSSSQAAAQFDHHPTSQAAAQSDHPAEQPTDSSAANAAWWDEPLMQPPDDEPLSADPEPVPASQPASGTRPHTRTPAAASVETAESADRGDFPADPAPASAPQSNPSPEDPTPRPWWLLTGVVLVLFASLGGNAYLGWITWDLRGRYQDLAADLHHLESQTETA